MIFSGWRAPFLAVIACVFFNILLGYGYLLSLVAQIIGVNDALGFGVLIVVVSALATTVGFTIGDRLFAAFFSGRSDGTTSVTPIAASLFAILQIFAFIPLLLAKGTLETEMYTGLELGVSIVTAFALVFLSRRMAGKAGHLSRAATSALAVAVTFPLIFVTLSLAGESYALSQSWLAYALYYSGYGILPAVLLCIGIAYARNSNRWAAAGFIASGLPLVLFYFAGLFGLG